MGQKRVLVTYYSRTGTTRDVAFAIREELGCEIEPIVDRTDRQGLLGWLRSGYDATFARGAHLEPIRRTLEDYDLVVVGTPVWNASVSSPVRTFLHTHASSIRAVAFFCTYGGSGAARALLQMQEICGQTPIATFTVREDAVAHADFPSKVRAYAAALEPSSVDERAAVIRGLRRPLVATEVQHG